MGTHVHTDGPYQEYYRAATVLLFWDFPRTTVSPYTPDEDGTVPSPNEADGVTFGPVDPFSLVGAVSYEAFKAAWAQKWRSFRRLRPEAMAGLVDLEQRQDGSSLDEPVIDDIIESDPAAAVLDVVAEYNGRQREQRFLDEDDGTAETYLLGQMYPEGSPTHPSYPSGHATMAGAGVTVLKALFDDHAPITATGMRPVGIDPDDPTEHVFIDRGSHADDGVAAMTVGSELDKLASNIAHARMFGGVHFRSDGERGIRLGEQVAIRFLQDHLRSYPETEFDGHFELTSRDGRRIRITPESVERASTE
jgi:membrane-associated phospholipid phosphatase